MTLLPMENRESILCALKCFSKEKPSSIPSILEEYIQNISRNGQTILPWVYVKPLILQKYDAVVERFTTDTISVDTEELKLRVFGVLKRLDGIPFTIQRICELLCAPTRQYSRLDKYLRGLEKVCRVVSTVDPKGNKIHHEDPRFPSQAGLEECMMDDSLFSPTTSPSDGDDITDEDGDNGSSSSAEPLLESSDTLPSGIDIHLSTPSWQVNSDASAVSVCKEAGDTLMTSPPSNEAEPPLLRPIGQLEAFVQNIAADIPSSSLSITPTAVSSTASNTKAFSLTSSSFSSDQIDVTGIKSSSCLFEASVRESDLTDTDMPMESSSDENSASDKNEPELQKPLTGFKRRASVSVDKSDVSSFDSEHPTDELGCEKKPFLERDEGEDRDTMGDLLAHNSPAKRRRLTVSQEDNSEVRLPEPVDPNDRVVDPQSSPATALTTTVTLNGSPPIIICSRPGCTLPPSTESVQADSLFTSKVGDTDLGKVDDNSSSSALVHEDIAKPELSDRQAAECEKESSGNST